MNGTRIGDFELGRILGQGGMGVVYSARDTSLNRVVAVKVLHSKDVGDPLSRRRLLREARAVSRLDHLNIVSVLTAGEEGGLPYIVMEVAEGEPLSQKLAHRKLAFDEIADYALQLADGLAFAHAAGVVHRDVKPANIMVSATGRLKVLDFGLAKVNAAVNTEQTEAGLTQTGVTIGTLAYMAPEQARGEEATPATDIYSFGVVLYEMIAGAKPFRGKTQIEVFHELVYGNPVPLAKARPGVPSALAAVAEKAMRRKPEERFASMADAVAQLREVKRSLAAKRSGQTTIVSWFRPTASAVRYDRLNPRLSRRSLLAAGPMVIAASLKQTGNNPRSIRGSRIEEYPLTQAAYLEMEPDITPDGSSVVYVYRPPGGLVFDLYVKRIGGGPAVQVTHSEADSLHPAWSPDGSFIAYSREFPDRGEIRVITPRGSGDQRLLTVRVPQAATTCWSPDGKWLAFGDGAVQDGGIFLYSLETSELRRLTSPPALANDASPKFSPDGQLLAFRRGIPADSSEELWVTPIRGGTLRRVWKQHGFTQGLAWTVPGDELIFASNLLGGKQLFRVSVSGGEQARPIHMSYGPGFPAIARKTGRMTYAQSFRVRNLWFSPVGGETREAFKFPTVRVHTPRFSPDGKRLAFVTDNSNFDEIWVANVDGSDPRQITSGGNRVPLELSWSPDGRNISYQREFGNINRVWTVPAAGGAPRPMSGPEADHGAPAWSPDGKWLYMWAQRTGRQEIWRQPWPSGPLEQVTRNGGCKPQISHDNRYLYYSKSGSGSLFRLRLDAMGENEETVAEIPELGDPSLWKVTSRGFYYLAVQPSPTLLHFDIATGHTRQIIPNDAIYSDNDRGFDISPDGALVAWPSMDETVKRIMVADGFS